MAEQTTTTLKTHFNKGDKPTEIHFHNLLESYLNKTDGGTVLGATTLGGATTIGNSTEDSHTLNGALTINNNLVSQMSLYGLNPSWAFNFGSPAVVASGTAIGACATLLTPISTLFNLSLALGKAAVKTAELTVAEASEIMGAVAPASTSKAIEAGATTGYFPANLNITRVTGNVGSDLTLTASTTNYAINQRALLIFSGNNVITNNQDLVFTTHTNAGLIANACEVIVSGAGNNIMTLETAASNADEIITLTASGGDTTILPGSYLYMYACHATDQVALKGCIRTTGGTIAVTFS